MEIKKVDQVILTLTAEEAQWLHYVMQNPIAHVHGDPSDEDERNREIRTKFFHATEFI